MWKRPWFHFKGCFLAWTVAWNPKAPLTIKADWSSLHVCLPHQTYLWGTWVEVHFSSPHGSDLSSYSLRGLFHTHTAAVVHLSICQRRFRRQSETRHGWSEVQGSQGRFILTPPGHRGRHWLCTVALIVCVWVWVSEWVGGLLWWKRKKVSTARERREATEICEKRLKVKETIRWSKRGSRNRLWWRCIQKKPPRSLTRAGYKEEEEDRRDIKKTSSLNTWFAWELISYTSTTETRRSTFLVLLFKQQYVPLVWQLRLDAKRKRQYLMTRKEHFVALTLVWVNHGLSAALIFGLQHAIKVLIFWASVGLR